MKKKLLAIAVAGTFAAPTVAMAEWSLSGSVSQSVSVTGSTVTLGGGSGSLGMSGSADLGNGVSGSASFSVTGSGGNAKVGLAGDFGDVKLELKWPCCFCDAGVDRPSQRAWQLPARSGWL